jgi:hypothetical protein
MRTAVAAAVAASSLLALPALTASAPAAPVAPAVTDSHDGTLTICFEGLGRHGKVNSSFTVEGLESGRGTSSASSGYSRPPRCVVQEVEERSRISFSFPAKDPYRLRSVRSTQTDGDEARVTVTRGMGVRVVLDEGDDVRVTLTYGRTRR